MIKMKIPCLYTATALKIVFCFISFSIMGQERVFKQGIYTSWEQLSANNPKFPLPTNIKYKKVRTYNIQDEIHRMAIIETSNEKAKKIGPVLAFSNGKELFFNRKKTTLATSPLFTLVEMHGTDYAVYNNLFSLGLNRKIGVGNFPMFCKIKGINVINFTDHKIHEINHKNHLKKFIAPDNQLLEQFQEEDHKNEVIKLYIIQYILNKNS